MSGGARIKSESGHVNVYCGAGDSDVGAEPMVCVLTVDHWRDETLVDFTPDAADEFADALKAAAAEIRKMRERR